MNRGLILAVIAALIVTGLLARSAGTTTTESYCAHPNELHMLDIINTYRAQNGLPTLELSQTLGAAAVHHSIDMGVSGVLSHTLSDGTTHIENMVKHGYTIYGRGEIIAWGFPTAEGALTWWQNSANHDPFLLDPDFRVAGVGYYYDASDSYGLYHYWTVTFGPKMDQPATVCGGPTSTPEPTKTPTSTPTATSTPDPLAPTATATNTPAPSATDTPEPTETPRPCRGKGKRACTPTPIEVAA